MRKRLVVIAVLLAVGALPPLAREGGSQSAPAGFASAGGQRIDLLAGVAFAATANPMQQCIQNCTSCRAACLKTLAYCRKKGGKHAERNHLRILQDSAEICQTSEGFMRRGSEFHPRTCGLCAEVCDACAKSCEQFPNDAQMKACAAACRRCGKSCHTMAGTTS
jgi:hypothetical protein